MSLPTFSLDQLGWRAFFSQQLTLHDLQAGFPARIASVQRSELVALTEHGELRITFGGVLQHSEASQHITVGDWALIEHDAPRVLRVLQRYGAIERLAAGGQHRQLIASNLDTVFVVTSCNLDFNASRLERYLVLAREAGVEAVLVITKADLCGDPQSYSDQANAIAPWASTLTLNATDARNVEPLRPWLERGQTVAFVGSSGVGKSTLVNTLLAGEQQRTAGIREDDARGRHTTTSRHMFALPSGAWVIDTPGMRELRIGAAESGVAAVFDDIEALARHCRYRDCRHAGDDGCAVAGAVQAGSLDARRLENFLKLQREAANAARTTRERREHERHMGRVHRSALRVHHKRSRQD